MREYELTYIVRPDIDDEAVAALAARIEQTITANGGHVLKSDSWGKRRLAYPIRRYNEGTYIFLRTELTDKAIREIDRQLKLSEDAIRHLLVRVEAPVEAPAEAAPPEVPTPPESPETA
ncbi:MAG TPA: 30S ribosomal protein S6 [Anaerolineae bacterium]|nr:30S ribosomal protein S6 [Anaerolineae bacterium]HOQ99613.1 30S ribosomal protein S6 [Anaerolineae bacterium]HPL28411.1 30S ribosomal protein S6 [Anaerolineae bacterium]